MSAFHPKRPLGRSDIRIRSTRDRTMSGYRTVSTVEIRASCVLRQTIVTEPITASLGQLPVTLCASCCCPPTLGGFASSST